jgi:hypothetical protein
MRFLFSGGSVEQAFRDHEKPMARAAVAALQEVADDAVKRGRENIAAAGFSARWQRALQDRLFPSGAPSLEARASIFDAMPFAGIFEEGGTISGKPLLWLPIDDNLPRAGISGRWTPSRYVRDVGPLVSVNRPGKPPMLFARSGQAGASLKPLFVGVSSVNIRKHFDLYRIFSEAASHLGEAYLRHLDKA